MCGALAQNFGKHLIRRRHPRARINHKEADVSHVNRALGQTAHAPLQAFVGRLFKASSVNHRKAQVRKACIAFTQIARDPRLVIDQSQTFANKAIE